LNISYKSPLEKNILSVIKKTVNKKGLLKALFLR